MYHVSLSHSSHLASRIISRIFVANVSSLLHHPSTMLSIRKIIHTTTLLTLTHPSSGFTSPHLKTSITKTTTTTTTRLFSTPPTRYLLNYQYVPDVLEKRGPYREGHLGLANDMIREGSCISGGPSLMPGESVPSGGE